MPDVDPELWILVHGGHDEAALFLLQSDEPPVSVDVAGIVRALIRESNDRFQGPCINDLIWRRLWQWHQFPIEVLIELEDDPKWLHEVRQHPCWPEVARLRVPIKRALARRGLKFDHEASTSKLRELEERTRPSTTSGPRSLFDDPDVSEELRVLGYQPGEPGQPPAIRNCRLASPEGSRVAPRERVFGIITWERHRTYALAYPYAMLRRTPIVNERVGNVAYLLVYDTVRSKVHAFARGYRMPDGTPRYFTFCSSGGTVRGFPVLQDVDTESYWVIPSGLCVYGPMQGTTLRRIDGAKQMPTALVTTLGEWARRHQGTSVCAGGILVEPPPR